MLVFEETGKLEYPEKNQVRESNPGHIGGRRALSPLRQPAPPTYIAIYWLNRLKRISQKEQ